MKSYLHSKSPSVYSALSEGLQTIRIKSRTREELELAFDQASPHNLQLHISDSAQVRLILKTAELISKTTTLECFLSKGSQLYIEEFYQHTFNLLLKVHLIEPYADINVKTRIQASNQSKITLNQQIFHRVGYTKASLNARAVVSDQSKLSIDTTLRVDNSAKSCVSLQNFAGLQLSPKSHIKAVPRLEIYNSDVVTQHGVSIRTIRPEEIWYLGTRGLTENKSRDIITAGFIT